jgi:hypothetical protein
LNRFPFVANEYFNCEVNGFLDKFFDGPELDESTSEKERSEQEKNEVQDFLLTIIGF